MGSIDIDGIEIPTIDVGDIDLRPLGLTITGFSDEAVISVALTPAGIPPGTPPGDYHVVAWTDDTQVAVTLPLGTDFDIAAMGPSEVYPRIKVTDGATLSSASGDTPLIITQIGVDVI
jgi:hypothetical protein